jgi:hypothetical protein
MQKALENVLLVAKQLLLSVDRCAQEQVGTGNVNESHLHENGRRLSLRKERCR